MRVAGATANVPARASRRGAKAPGAWLCGVFGALLMVGMPGALAQDGNGGVLAECAGLSPLLDDIHACLDDYLDVMDENIADIVAFIERSLDEETAAAFLASQRAFADYRRENCLWYLAFSEPRVEAEQLAKDCLATMSLQRLSELQRLIASNEEGDVVQDGYYVYGANRNSFRPCGSDARYWVEGEPEIVGELQQRYLDIVTTERQVLFASLRGPLDDEATAPSGHDGVLRARSLVELRVPREADCRVPAGVPSVVAGAPPVTLPGAPGEAPAVGVEAVGELPSSAPDEVPAQRLAGYFGAWAADCTERRALRACTLSTALVDARAGRAAGQGTLEPAGLDAGEGAAAGAGGARLSLERRDAERTTLELFLPGREVDSPGKIRWRVDGDVLGDIVGSAIRVDERGTRQLVEEPRYLRQELLPRMIAGGTLGVEVLGSIDDERGARFSATLVGLTRALGFADGFVRDGNGL